MKYRLEKVNWLNLFNKGADYDHIHFDSKTLSPDGMFRWFARQKWLTLQYWQDVESDICAKLAARGSTSEAPITRLYYWRAWVHHLFYYPLHPFKTIGILVRAFKKYLIRRKHDAKIVISRVWKYLKTHHIKILFYIFIKWPFKLFIVKPLLFIKKKFTYKGKGRTFREFLMRCYFPLLTWFVIVYVGGSWIDYTISLYSHSVYSKSPDDDEWDGYAHSGPSRFPGRYIANYWDDEEDYDMDDEFFVFDEAYHEDGWWSGTIEFDEPEQYWDDIDEMIFLYMFGTQNDVEAHQEVVRNIEVIRAIADMYFYAIGFPICFLVAEIYIWLFGPDEVWNYIDEDIQREENEFLLDMNNVDVLESDDEEWEIDKAVVEDGSMKDFVINNTDHYMCVMIMIFYWWFYWYETPISLLWMAFWHYFMWGGIFINYWLWLIVWDQECELSNLEIAFEQEDREDDQDEFITYHLVDLFRDFGGYNEGLVDTWDEFEISDEPRELDEDCEDDETSILYSDEYDEVHRSYRKCVGVRWYNEGYEYFHEIEPTQEEMRRLLECFMNDESFLDAHISIPEDCKYLSHKQFKQIILPCAFDADMEELYDEVTVDDGIEYLMNLSLERALTPHEKWRLYQLKALPESIDCDSVLMLQKYKEHFIENPSEVCEIDWQLPVELDAMQMNMADKIDFFMDELRWGELVKTNKSLAAFYLFAYEIVDDYSLDSFSGKSIYPINQRDLDYIDVSFGEEGDQVTDKYGAFPMIGNVPYGRSRLYTDTSWLWGPIHNYIPHWYWDSGVDYTEVYKRDDESFPLEMLPIDLLALNKLKANSREYIIFKRRLLWFNWHGTSPSDKQIGKMLAEIYLSVYKFNCLITAIANCGSDSIELYNLAVKNTVFNNHHANKLLYHPEFKQSFIFIVDFYRNFFPYVAQSIRKTLANYSFGPNQVFVSSFIKPVQLPDFFLFSSGFVYNICFSDAYVRPSLDGGIDIFYISNYNKLLDPNKIYNTFNYIILYKLLFYADTLINPPLEFFKQPVLSELKEVCPDNLILKVLIKLQEIKSLTSGYYPDYSSVIFAAGQSHTFRPYLLLSSIESMRYTRLHHGQIYYGLKNQLWQEGVSMPFAFVNPKSIWTLKIKNIYYPSINTFYYPNNVPPLRDPYKYRQHMLREGVFEVEYDWWAIWKWKDKRKLYSLKYLMAWMDFEEDINLGTIDVSDYIEMNRLSNELLRERLLMQVEWDMRHRFPELYFFDSYIQFLKFFQVFLSKFGFSLDSIINKIKFIENLYYRLHRYSITKSVLHSRYWLKHYFKNLILVLLRLQSFSLYRSKLSTVTQMNSSVLLRPKDIFRLVNSRVDLGPSKLRSGFNPELSFLYFRSVLDVIGNSEPIYQLPIFLKIDKFKAYDKLLETLPPYEFSIRVLQDALYGLTPGWTKWLRVRRDFNNNIKYWKFDEWLKHKRYYNPAAVLHRVIPRWRKYLRWKHVKSMFRIFFWKNFLPLRRYRLVKKFQYPFWSAPGKVTPNSVVIKTHIFNRATMYTILHSKNQTDYILKHARRLKLKFLNWFL